MSTQEELLSQAQPLQQQLQSLLFQKETLSMQSIEIKKAVEELDKTKETTVYKITGPILVKAIKKDIKKDLDEKEEAISLRIKKIEKTEMQLKDKLNSIREKLTQKIGG
ncbi:MAG: prefoldin subunit beta [Nanoarchaeota archaeon]|nr:prefoldin subunit beta [Nanoarchaeota archaeon]MBU1135552.1 prefoldin subunit beta [Nanoarchaeota archaeon]MBU2520383.1 prefoldin subunit beta [Nanoarchaeota archaeon]